MVGASRMRTVNSLFPALCSLCSQKTVTAKKKVFNGCFKQQMRLLIHGDLEKNAVYGEIQGDLPTGILECGPGTQKVSWAARVAAMRFGSEVRPGFCRDTVVYCTRLRCCSFEFYPLGDPLMGLRAVDTSA